MSIPTKLGLRCSGQQTEFLLKQLDHTQNEKRSKSNVGYLLKKKVSVSILVRTLRVFAIGSPPMRVQSVDHLGRHYVEGKGASIAAG